MKILTVCYLILISRCGATGLLEKNLSISDVSVSPNKLFIAVSKKSSESDFLTILSSETNDLVYDKRVFPIFKIAWANDSKSLGICEHIAGGSQFVVLRSTNGAWDRTEFNPPLPKILLGERRKCSVINMVDKGQYWRVNLLIRKDKATNNSVYYSIVDVNIYHRSNKLIVSKVRPISIKESSRIKTLDSAH